jgi:hypothetical protein
MLRSGKQSVNIPTEIQHSNIRLKNASFQFNIKVHGFYQTKIYLSFLPTNSVQNNIGTSNSRVVIIPINQRNDYYSHDMDLDLGSFKIPRAFQVEVDLDSGLQVVPTVDTVIGQKYSFKPDVFDLTNEKDYIQLGTAPAGQIATPGYDAFTSIGLLSGNVTTPSSDSWSPDHIFINNQGQRSGPIPFLYSLLLTFEYDETF